LLTFGDGSRRGGVSQRVGEGGRGLEEAVAYLDAGLEATRKTQKEEVPGPTIRLSQSLARSCSLGDILVSRWRWPSSARTGAAARAAARLGRRVANDYRVLPLCGSWRGECQLRWGRDTGHPAALCLIPAAAGAMRK
jgi:hypothetical protein